MDEFPLCPECEEEYKDPKCRRFHAETTACEKCGPELTLNDTHNFGATVNGYDAITKASELLKKGEIISVKGIGGFHWVCALNKDSIEKLRKLNKRPNKPFALMVKDLDMAREYVEISDEEEKVLTSPAKPITLLKRRPGPPPVPGPIEAASNLSTLGIMLPYTALHYLLFEHIDQPLIYTSANIKDEPISYRKDQQKTQYLLVHERSISNPVDDSVVKIVNNKPLFLRKSRGFVPYSFDVPRRFAQKLQNMQILALGAEMNSSISVYKDGKIWVSEYIGNTWNLKTFEYFKKKVGDFLKLLGCKPDVILCDKHPVYATSEYAEDLAEEFKAKLIKVQHHKAHVTGAYLENLADIGSDDGRNNDIEFIGISADGTGYGDDQTVWGGECFHFKNGKFHRVGCNNQFMLIGGEIAVRDYEKLAVALLMKYFSNEQVYEFMEKLEFKLMKNDLNVLIKMHEENFNCFPTTSIGRVLDAISFVLGLKEKRTYEGEGALVLESYAMKSDAKLPIDIKIYKDEDRWKISYKNLFEYLMKNLNKKKEDLARIALLYIAESFKELLNKADTSKNLPRVFSGGVAQSSIITPILMDAGVLTHKNIPAGDGGISFGQIACYLFCS
jgi:hydrogenase maturation protein HypF